MTQEEKAKAYDEALERAKEMIKAMTNIGGVAKVDDIQYLFPELAESEDEKMINGLQGFLSAYGSDYFGTDGWQKFDDWLEKQKEQKPVENGGKELLYVSNKSYNIGYRDGKREAEQKTAEWSEEDENTIQEIIGCIEQARADSHLSEDHCLRLETFLYNHYRPSWKPSEEQMRAFKSYIEDSQSKAEAAVGGWDKFDVMIHLYEQLKKL